MKTATDDRKRISIATKADFDVSYFCGSGPGGQARNKSATGVQIIHRETGAIGRASDSRSQMENRNNAFRRLVATPKFKFFIAAKKYEILQRETMEETVDKSMTDENMKYEIKGADGKWTEVEPSFFNTPESRQECPA